MKKKPNEDEEWNSFISETFKPEFEFILSEINRLFELEKSKAETNKNVELIRIYLPQKNFDSLTKALPSFGKFHNLGGVPVIRSKKEIIGIDIEVVNPRKRKKKAVVYIKELKEENE